MYCCCRTGAAGHRAVEDRTTLAASLSAFPASEIEDMSMVGEREISKEDMFGIKTK